jgi:hypothetical protein
MSKIIRQLPRDLNEPHPDRLSELDPNREEILLLHQVAMALDQPGYTDPASGYFVFTAKKLLSENKCCANLCRHCPFKR